MTNSRTDVQVLSSTDFNNHNNKWLPKQTSEEKCQIRLLQKLLELKKQNILRRCFLLDSNEFEVLEFYGDAYLYERVSYFIMTTRRFMDPNLMTKLRCSCIKNANLAAVFEQLKLFELFESAPVNLPLKSKADILEAIIGELAEEGSSVSEDLLTELIAYIAYMGDKEYFQEANANTSISSLGGQTVTKQKNKPRRRHRSRKESVNSTSNNRTLDNKSTVVNSGLSSPPDKHPLFILLRPTTNPMITNNLSLSQKQQPPPSTSQPQPPGRIIRLEPFQMNNESRLPVLNSISPLPPAPVPPAAVSPVVKEPFAIYPATRNIIFHKLFELSTSSESSSGSASLSSSPRNLFLYPSSMTTANNGLSFKNPRISEDLLKVNEIKRL